MKRFKPEFQNVQITVRSHGTGHIKIDTSTADPNEWANVKELDFMIEDDEQQTAAPVVVAQAPDYSAMSLNQLRELFPDIKANSKAKFLEQL
jgi:hypothetical protein